MGNSKLIPTQHVCYDSKWKIQVAIEKCTQPTMSHLVINEHEIREHRFVFYISSTSEEYTPKGKSSITD